MPITIPATGSGTATPIVSTDNVTADSSQVQNVALVTVSGGVLTRLAAPTQYVEDVAMGATPTGTAIMGYGSTAVPTAVNADGDAVTAWYNRNGVQIVGFAPHVALVGSPWTLTSKTVQTTTTQTSGVVMAGGASETLVVTSIQIQAGGTVAGTVQVYFGTAAYSRGTSRAIFDGEFAPSATLKPGVIMQGPFIAGAAGDDVLVTTSAAINPLTITIWYYVVT